MRLTEGYDDVFLTRQSGSSRPWGKGNQVVPLTVFFDTFTLANSSALGSKMNGALDLESFHYTPLSNVIITSQTIIYLQKQCLEVRLTLKFSNYILQELH